MLLIISAYICSLNCRAGEMFAEEVSPQQNSINQNLFENQQQELDSQVSFPSEDTLKKAINICFVLLTCSSKGLQHKARPLGQCFKKYASCNYAQLEKRRK